MVTRTRSKGSSSPSATLGFQQRKPISKRARAPAKKSEVAATAARPATEVRRDASKEAEPADSHLDSHTASSASQSIVSQGEAVKVDPLIKRVYRVIDQRSYLVWGLTTDWMVDTSSSKRESKYRPSHSSTTSLSAFSFVDQNSRDSIGSVNQVGSLGAPGAPDRDDASEGYGETTAGSIQRMLNLLQQLDSTIDTPFFQAASRKSTAARKKSGAPLSGWSLTEDSKFCDIGSGYGKVVLHAKLAVGMQYAEGVEYVESRSTIAAEVLEDLRQCRTAVGPVSPQLLHGISFVAGDATARPTLDFSHVYIYDKVFSDETTRRIAVLLNKSPVKILVSYRRMDTWNRLGLEQWKHLTSLTMNTTGNQNFRAHVYFNARFL